MFSGRDEAEVELAEQDRRRRLGRKSAAAVAVARIARR